jgi:hypothetical protein
MNHVPTDVLNAIDEFGESLLTGTAVRVNGQLRQDLRVGIWPTDATTATCRYETEHTQAPPVLRDRGPYVTTIVDGIDDRLRSWGIDPPPAYTHTTTVDGTHQYEGTLQLR